MRIGLRMFMGSSLQSNEDSDYIEALRHLMVIEVYWVLKKLLLVRLVFIVST